MKTVRKISTLLFILFFISINVFPVSLNQLRIVADDGTFLGTFENEYSTNSVYVNAENRFPEFAGFRFPLLGKKIY